LLERHKTAPGRPQTRAEARGASPLKAWVTALSRTARNLTGGTKQCQTQRNIFKDIISQIRECESGETDDFVSRDMNTPTTLDELHRCTSSQPSQRDSDTPTCIYKVFRKNVRPPARQSSSLLRYQPASAAVSP